MNEEDSYCKNKVISMEHFSSSRELLWSFIYLFTICIPPAALVPETPFRCGKLAGGKE